MVFDGLLLLLLLYEWFTTSIMVLDRKEITKTTKFITYY